MVSQEAVEVFRALSCRTFTSASTIGNVITKVEVFGDNTFTIYWSFCPAQHLSRETWPKEWGTGPDAFLESLKDTVLWKEGTVPNWCDNKMRVAGKPDELKRFFFALTVVENGTPCILKSLIPMPDILEGTVSGSANQANITAAGYKSHGEWQGACVAATGHKDWYDWQLANWGCKWGDSDATVTAKKYKLHAVLIFRFTSPWGPPEVAFETIKEQWPELRFSLWFNEPGCGSHGYL